MTAFRVTLGIFCVTIAAAGCGYWNAHATPAGSMARSPWATTAISRDAGSWRDITGIPRPAAIDDSPRRDLYGNEIEDAMGDYRFDAGGETYERHSPQTEVPKLTEPHT